MENKYFPCWKVIAMVMFLTLIKGIEVMSNDKQTISKQEAADSLESVASVKHEADALLRIPLMLIVLISLSFSLIVFSWGMTEHENIWALGMYVGWGSFAIFTALGVYTHRLLGIKASVLIRTKAKLKSTLVSAVLFGSVFVAGRELRLLGVEYAPHMAALIAGCLLGYLLYRYPTGEYFSGNS